MLYRFFMVLDCLYNLIKGDEALNALVEIAAVLEVLDILHDILDLALCLWV